MQHWAKTGRIPAQWHERLLELAREKGIALEPRHFVASNGPEIAPADASSACSWSASAQCRPPSSPASSTSGAAWACPSARSPRWRRSASASAPTAIRRPSGSSSPSRSSTSSSSARGPDRGHAYEGGLKCGVLNRLEDLDPIGGFPEVGRADAGGVRHGVREADRRRQHALGRPSCSSSTGSARTCAGSRPSTAATGSS